MVISRQKESPRRAVAFSALATCRRSSRRLRPAGRRLRRSRSWTSLWRSSQSTPTNVSIMAICGRRCRRRRRMRRERRRPMPMSSQPKRSQRLAPRTCTHAIWPRLLADSRVFWEEAMAKRSRCPSHTTLSRAASTVRGRSANGRPLCKTRKRSSRRALVSATRCRTRFALVCRTSLSPQWVLALKSKRAKPANPSSPFGGPRR
mmetsp:Transcript_27897/g.65530  ORF Transcript_27897/g.65530 Transcript_27897/m.65530 type:complete len:204 (-) Transcript_27897:1459-2070(-)